MSSGSSIVICMVARPSCQLSQEQLSSATRPSASSTGPCARARYAQVPGFSAPAGTGPSARACDRPWPHPNPSHPRRSLCRALLLKLEVRCCLKVGISYESPFQLCSNESLRCWALTPLHRIAREVFTATSLLTFRFAGPFPLMQNTTSLSLPTTRSILQLIA